MKLMNPKSIAIIGASNDKKKLGFQILDNLIKSGFKGKIYPVNLKDQKVAGLKAFSDVQGLKNKVEMAVIIIPAKFVLAEVKKCAVSGIKNIIIISAGFSEIGGEGKKIEEELERIGRKNNLNILGPNCLGLINSWNNMNATFASAQIKKGNVAFLSQSGAVGSAVLDWVQDKNFGLSYFVSLGNKTVLDENAFFSYLQKDKSTDLVIAYLEEIEQGQKFMETVSKLSKVKPVAILKSGKTEAGKTAALSHTGSLAGSTRAVETGLKRSGAISLDSLEEAFNLMKLIQRKPKVKNSKIFLLSNAGGPMVITADQIDKYGLSLGKFSKRLETDLRKKLPEINTIQNPFDIIGDADASRYQRALEVILKDKDVSNVLVLLTPQTTTEVKKTAEIIVKLGKKYKDKLICTSFIGGKSLDEAKNLLEKNNIPSFHYPVQAVKALSQYLNYQGNLKTLKDYSWSKGQETGNIEQLGMVNNHVKRQWDYIEAFQLLKKYNIPVIKTEAVKSESDFKKTKYPVALKVVGPELIHKTDLNSIALDIENEAEAKKAYKSFAPLLRDKRNYCVSQAMLRGGLEMILGFKRDESFGPLLMVGFGGIYAEVLKDIQFEVDDIDYVRALEMVKSLKSYKILSGARGKAKLDTVDLAKTIVKVAKLAKENKEIEELDINPLFITEKGVIAADVRIIS